MKMKFVKHCLIASAVGLFAATGAFAQEEPKAQSLEQLLEMVKENRILETREHQQREAQFRRDKANQQELLNEARQTLANEERRAEQLEDTYEQQEQQVVQKRQEMQQRLGSLDELFGHLTSQAGDLRQRLESSIVSAQPGLSGRAGFLTDLINKMNSATEIPEIEEIEQLWFEMQREAVEAGKIVRFPATVLKTNGERVQEEVVRVGNYNLMSASGNYLYMTQDGQIAELPRQPAGNFTDSAAQLASAEEGFVRVGIDPTGAKGGSFLQAIVDLPSLVEQWHQGQEIGYAITALGVFAVLLGLFRLLVLSGVSRKVTAQLRSDEPNTNNPLGRILLVGQENKGIDNESLELKLEEAIIKERPAIESGLNLLKVIFMIAPLMGLLGTVGGMIQTFQAITIYGTGDPSTMAAGISAALVTTMLGLIVAIPTMLIHTIVAGRAKRILHVIDEQSAGIIAENAER
ncbi:MotA/TolQ/ExbB proton channel family protein [Gilvimarinus sp. F26214L]|uniref:MotA/TolQ/ExbB proton channel family protein n=1 Tax=Gilvimarinus sp. DZF01 TaxID=3461371 RepID=UPI0040453E11